MSANTVRLLGSTMASVWSVLDSTSSAFDGVPPPARRTPEASRIAGRRTQWTLIFMIVHYTPYLRRLPKLRPGLRGMDGREGAGRYDRVGGAAGPLLPLPNLRGL